MLQFRSAHGAILAWRQSAGAPEPTTAKPRRGWYVLARGVGRVHVPTRRSGAAAAASVSLAATGGSGALSASASSPAVVALAATGASGTLAATAGSGTSVAVDITGASGTLSAVAYTPATVALAALGGSGALSASASVSGGTASAAEVWSYMMSNGYTAEENVVAIRSMLEALTPATIAEEVLHNALV